MTKLCSSVADRTDLPYDLRAFHRVETRSDGGTVSSPWPDLDPTWDGGVKLLWHARVLELDHHLPVGTIVVEQLERDISGHHHATGRVYGIHDAHSGRGWMWQTYSDAWSQISAYMPGLSLAHAMSGALEAQGHTDIPGSVDNPLGGTPRSALHVYARDPASGSGNCRCGRPLGDWWHTEAAAGVPIPRAMRVGGCPW